MCTPKMAVHIGAVLENESLSVATIAPPRKTEALIEAICAKKPDKSSLLAKLYLLSAVYKTKRPLLTITPMGNLDWLKKVAADFPPLTIGCWTIYGSAHRSKVKNKHLALQIDATSAFGTGEHPTTRGCLMLLEKLIKESHKEKRDIKQMLDIGCGSGILAIAFTKACDGKAIAVDNDRQSVAIARNNARNNKVDKRITLSHSNGFSAKLIFRQAPYDLVMANILANPLKEMAKDIKRHLNRQGTVILSGILNSQVPEVLAAYRRQNFTLRHKLRLGEWTALALIPK